MAKSELNQSDCRKVISQTTDPLSKCLRKRVSGASRLCNSKDDVFFSFVSIYRFFDESLKNADDPQCDFVHRLLLKAVEDCFVGRQFEFRIKVVHDLLPFKEFSEIAIDVFDLQSWF